MLSRFSGFFGFVVLSLFLHRAYATETFYERMSAFRESLLSIQPKLKDSVVDVSGKDGHFVCAGDGVTEQSQFYIGSVSKQITAFMFLKALQQKHPKADLLSLLNQNLAKAFPESVLLKQLDRPWTQEITLLDLLTHRSGLADYIDVYENQLKTPEALGTPLTPVEILQAVTFNPAKPYVYGNTTYFLLGKLIEEMLGQTYAAAFDALVKEPAHMHNSHTPTGGNYQSLKDKPSFETLREDLNTQFFIDFANVGGAGGLISTAEDLLKWNHYLYHHADPALKDAMLVSYCIDADGDQVNLGLTTMSTAFGECSGFQGGLDSYKSFLAYIPSHDLSLAILSNNSEDFDLLLEKLLSFMRNEPDI